ncbi:hypothetical protein MANES_05G025350v8 [Manihot esculenta]|uniref:Uncharacterized protein n=1 Tax=Manihot esculenta TaxID=3983 RepID=A0A251KSE8_MANES|nr:hypothetical protein MANES_05G025350v8 [Manihot esculenta]
MKVNVNASTGSSMSFVGLGAVVSDSYREFVAAKVWRYPSFFSAKNCIIEILSWIKSKGWQRVLIESDALSVVQIINSSEFTLRSSFELIVSNCKFLLSEIVDTKCCFNCRSRM